MNDEPDHRALHHYAGLNYPRLQTLLAIAQVLEVELTDLLPPRAPDLTAR